LGPDQEDRFPGRTESRRAALAEVTRFYYIRWNRTTKKTISKANCVIPGTDASFERAVRHFALDPQRIIDRAARASEEQVGSEEVSTDEDVDLLLAESLRSVLDSSEAWSTDQSPAPDPESLESGATTDGGTWYPSGAYWPPSADLVGESAAALVSRSRVIPKAAAIAPLGEVEECGFSIGQEEINCGGLECTLEGDLNPKYNCGDECYIHLEYSEGVWSFVIEWDESSEEDEPRTWYQYEGTIHHFYIQCDYEDTDPGCEEWNLPSEMTPECVCVNGGVMPYCDPPEEPPCAECDTIPVVQDPIRLKCSQTTFAPGDTIFCWIKLTNNDTLLHDSLQVSDIVLWFRTSTSPPDSQMFASASGPTDSAGGSHAPSASGVVFASMTYFGAPKILSQPILSTVQPPDLIVSCPGSVTRGTEITCTAKLSGGGQIVGIAWKFTPDAAWSLSTVNRGTITGPVDSSSWTGKVLWSGAVRVDAVTNVGANPVGKHVRLEVTPRSGAMTDLIEFATPRDTVLSIATPSLWRDVAFTTFHAWNQTAPSSADTSMGSGPNEGYVMLNRINVRVEPVVHLNIAQFLTSGYLYTNHVAPLPLNPCQPRRRITNGWLENRIRDHEGTNYQFDQNTNKPSHTLFFRNWVQARGSAIQDEAGKFVYEGTTLASDRFRHISGRLENELAQHSINMLDPIVLGCTIKGIM
jgi:hypothetical protein